MIDQKSTILDLLVKVVYDDEFDKIAFEILKKKNKICIPNMEILRVYRELIQEGILKEDDRVMTMLRKQRARSISGISAITILTKPYYCPGECVYCPTEARMPKSYLSDEPAVMRAVLNHWDAKKQVDTRIKALNMMGHPTSKCEMIILGGTFSVYDKTYMDQYILEMYNALNKEESKDLIEAQSKNEFAEDRAVGLSIETRPDYVDVDEIIRLRKYGVTKVEMGVQSLNDAVLDLTKRGHKVSEVRRATKLLKDAGVKIHYHMMPSLPGSSTKEDIQMFEDLFSDEDFKPDMLKIYPCVVTHHSELAQWEKDGKYKSPTDEEVINMLMEVKQKVPFYCRIMRLGRDIPANDILSGNRITNIREVVRDRMKEKKIQCVCQRCREVGFNTTVINNVVLFRFDFDSSGGREVYLEYRDEHTEVLLAFLRLRIPSQYFTKEKHFIPALDNCAIIREVHTYGFALKVATQNKTATQHKGYGKLLINEAIHIAKEEFILNKIAVISGIGVRDYYRQQGFELKDTYMVKTI